MNVFGDNSTVAHTWVTQHCVSLVLQDQVLAAAYDIMKPMSQFLTRV